MRSRVRTIAALVAALLLVPAVPAAAKKGPDLPYEEDGVLKGAPFEIRVPDDWNGTLLLYAHGYEDKADGIDGNGDPEIDPRTIPGFDVDSAPGGDGLENVLLSMGYALAGSQYSDAGWAVEEGLEDTKKLLDHFRKTVGKPDTTLLWGFSMGSLVTLETADKHPGKIDGYLAGCSVGAGAPAAWDAGLALLLGYDTVFGLDPAWGTVRDVRDTLQFEEVAPSLLGQVLNPLNFGAFEFIRMVSSIPAAGFYSGSNWLFTDMYFATEARAELERRAGGPFVSNEGHWYSLDPGEREYLNGLGVSDAQIEYWLGDMNRTWIRPEKKARKYVEKYAEYKGKIKDPVLTMHTTTDGLVPVEHEGVYAQTVADAKRSENLVQVYTDSVGHCTFSPQQLIIAVTALETWVETGVAPGPASFPAALGFVPGFVPGPWPQPI